MSSSSSTSPTNPALPHGWNVEFSKSKGKEYFFHPATGTSLWTLQEVLEYASRVQKSHDNTVSSTPTTATHAQPPPSVLSEMELINQELSLEDTNFKKMVCARLDALLQDDDAVKAQFDPCSGEKRQLIHEAAQDRGLLSQSEEDGDAKWVVAYKEGHLPEAPQPDLSDMLIKKKKKRVGADRPPPPITQDMQVLGTNKRDRRTIEELEKEREIRRKS